MSIETETKVMRLPICLIVMFSTALLLACAEVQAPEPTPAPPMDGIDVSGEWEFQDEGTAQLVVLDEKGNGVYSWQNGRIITTLISGRQWEGMWYQEGNDREGGFALTLSEDGREAVGTWWYTRIGTRNIPTRAQGGSFRFTRISSSDRRTIP
jgi:hypothetical protein